MRDEEYRVENVEAGWQVWIPDEGEYYDVEGVETRLHDILLLCKDGMIFAYPRGTILEVRP